MKGMRNIAPFGLRMTDELREAISERAKRNGRSINSEIVHILLERINDDAMLDDALIRGGYQELGGNASELESLQEKIIAVQKSENELLKQKIAILSKAVGVNDEKEK